MAKQEAAESRWVNLRVTAGRGLIWSAGERWGGQLLGVAVFMLLARLLDKRVFGAIALANLYIGFVQIFLAQGIGIAIIQRRDLRTAHLDTAFWLNISIALTFAAFTVAFRDKAAEMLGGRDVAPVLAWLALTLPLSALSVVPNAILSREMRFRVLAARSLATTVISGAVGIGAALLGFGVWSLVFQQLTAACTGTALAWSTVSWRPGLRANSRALADFAPFIVSVTGNDLLWVVSQRVDQAFIGRGLGVEALGVYAVSVRLVTLTLESLTAPTQQVAMPLFSEIQHEPERLRHAFLRSTSMICAVAFPAFLGLLLVGPRLIPFLVGDKWDAAIVPMQILCVGGCLRALQTFVHPSMMALGRPTVYTALFGFYAVAAAVGSWFAAEHGVNMIAWAMVIASGLTGVCNFIVLSRLLRFSLASIAGMLVPILTACIFLALAVCGIDRILGPHFLSIAVISAETLVGAAIYVAAIVILAPRLWMELWRACKLLIGQRRLRQG